MNPLRKSEGIVEPALVNEMFYEIPEILKYHEGFLKQLAVRVQDWSDNSKLGDIFVSAVSFIVDSLLVVQLVFPQLNISCITILMVDLRRAHFITSVQFLRPHHSFYHAVNSCMVFERIVLVPVFRDFLEILLLSS